MEQARRLSRSRKLAFIVTLMVCSLTLFARRFYLYGEDKSGFPNGYDAAGKGDNLTPSDLLTEYEGLVPINEALHQGKWVVRPGDYPKAIGTLDSKPLQEIFFCGDVCPTYATVAITYVGVTKDECPSAGVSLFSSYWGTQYQGCSPLFVRDGQIKEKDGSWILSYEERRGSPLEMLLVFNDKSICNKSGEQVSCGEFRENTRAAVKGIKSGESVVVLKLEI
ncbi:MAG: hypothetical protein ACRD2S_09300 [Terriglobales bacterium]